MAVHALSYPLGGRYRIPHGISNAILLPWVMEFNRDTVTDRFAEVAAAMGIPPGADDGETSKKTVEGIFSLVRSLASPRTSGNWESGKKTWTRSSQRR